MGKIKNFAEKYLYHPKQGRIASWCMGGADACFLYELSNYLNNNSENLDGVLFTLGSAILTHYIAIDIGKKRQEKESKLIEKTK